MDPAGHILVDQFQNTNKSNIYAIGDVCGKYLLTPGTETIFKIETNLTKFIN